MSNSKHKRVIWFDVPVPGLGRPAAFQAVVRGVGVAKERSDEVPSAVIVHKEGHGGCLVVRPDEVAATGALAYPNADGRIREAVARAREPGGQVLEDGQLLGPHGFRAVVPDAEGNRSALPSNTDASFACR